jgi:hypothetical protein
MRFYLVASVSNSAVPDISSKTQDSRNKKQGKVNAI